MLTCSIRNLQIPTVLAAYTYWTNIYTHIFSGQTQNKLIPAVHKYEMRNRWWPLVSLLLLMQTYLGCATGDAWEEKTEVMMPGAAATTTLSPPEGNTTFLVGTMWCVAMPGVSQVDLQNALDWACGMGSVDCRPIQQGGPCYQPNNLLSHASYAFNAYFQQNGNSDVACNFGGTAAITKQDPSYGRCSFSVSEPEKSASTIMIYYKWRLIASTLLVWYFGR